MSADSLERVAAIAWFARQPPDRREALQKNADQVADDLEALLPPEVWGSVNLVWVLHGRRVCEARKPKCGECVLRDICPKVGV